MTEEEWIIASILAIICAIPAALIPFHLFPKWKNGINRFLEVRRTGLKAIFPRIDPSSKRIDKDPLEDLLKEVAQGDRLLIVGRTNLALIRENEGAIEESVRRGVSIEFLLLDRGALVGDGPGRKIDLRSLGILDAEKTLSRDLGSAESKLNSLRNKCRIGQWKGSLLVYRTTVLLQNSAVILFPKSPGTSVRILYDFSFGVDRSQKWVQYYRSKRNSPSTFTGQLSSFYSDMFTHISSSFAYELSYRPPITGSAEKGLDCVAQDRIATIVKTHSESEAVRHNSLNRILPAAGKVFRTLHSNRNPIQAPLSAQIELTNICTTSCQHCNRYRKTDEREMQTDMAIQLLDDLSALGVETVTLSGGEPTLHSNFIQILEYAATKNIEVGVLSNGVGLSDETIYALYQHAKWLRLSVDGSSAAIYQQVRHSLTAHQNPFRAVENTIKRITSLNRVALRCSLAICYTIQRKNADDVPNMITWVQSLGIPQNDKCLTFKFAHGGRDSNADFLCTEQQVRHLYEEVFTQKSIAGAANLEYLKWFLDNQSGVRATAEGRPTQSLYEQQPTRCFTPHLFSLIDPKGDIYPCCFLYEDNSDYSHDAANLRQEHCIGSLKTARFKDIWEGVGYQKVRRELSVIDPQGKYSACSECTRHCNHNVWLTKLHSEYEGLRAAGGDADAVLNAITPNKTSGGVWL